MSAAKTAAASGDEAFETAASPKLAALANAISTAITEATVNGLRLDAACSVVLAVAADYVRGEYGPEVLPRFATIVAGRGEFPLPQPISSAIAKAEGC